MPVDDSADVDLNSAEVNLEELDKKATKAVKSLERERKALAKAKQELSKKGDTTTKGSVEPTKSEKSTQSITDDFEKLIDSKIKVGFREALADQAGGRRGANVLYSIGKNPKAYVSGVLRAIPFIGGVVAAAEFAQAIIAELEKIDRFFVT